MSLRWAKIGEDGGKRKSGAFPGRFIRRLEALQPNAPWRFRLSRHWPGFIHAPSSSTQPAFGVSQCLGHELMARAWRWQASIFASFLAATPRRDRRPTPAAAIAAPLPSARP